MWKIWAVLEGLTKTASSLIQKTVGLVMGTLEMGCVVAIIIGAIQSASGLCGHLWNARKDEKKISLLIPDARSISYAILFGFFAGIFGTVLSVYTFTLGADIGIRTLLINFSVVPGAIFGWLVWKDPLGARQWIGIAIFLVAIWAMLDFPSLNALRELPAWVWLTLVVAFAQVANEMLSRASGVKLNIWTNNFWVGTSTVFFSVCGLALFSLVSGDVTLSMTRTFVGGTLIVSCIVVAMISFKLLAYQGGGTIALKKIIMPGTYLVTSALAGVLVYGEPLTTGKIIGIILWPLAILPMDNDAWSVVRNSFSFTKKETKSA